MAEISCNHCGSLDKALALIDAAAAADADAVKLQCYTPDTITLNDRDNPELIIQGGPWHGYHLYDLYTETHTPFDWFPKLFEHAKRAGITLFSSVFDRGSVDFLEGLGCPAYKIASMEIVDTPLIRYAAQTGKPLIISTGMASDEEIIEARRAAGKNAMMLHCVSGYPSTIEEANLCKLARLHDGGISDHTLGYEVAVAATALGATIIEKHLMLFDFKRYLLEGPQDGEFSMTPSDFKVMAAKVRSIWKAMQPSKALSEESSRQLRRSLYVVKNIKKGERFTSENVRSIRPGYGLPPKHYDNILGRRATQSIRGGTALKWEHIDEKMPVADDAVAGGVR